MWRTVLVFFLVTSQLEAIPYAESNDAYSILAQQEEQTPLMRAVSDCDPASVESLLEAGVAIDGEDHYGYRLLELAASSRTGGDEAVAILKLLVSRGANAKQWFEGQNLLHVACRNDCLPQIKYLVDTLHFDVNEPTRDSLGYRPLHLAQTLGASRLLVERGAKVDATDGAGQTPLHTTTLFPDVMGFLISQRMPVNVLDHDHQSPLYEAASTSGFPSCLESVGLLLDSGANPNLGSEQGQSPLLAAIYGRAECTPVLKLLIERGANPKALTQDGAGLLHQAAVGGTPNVADYLVDFLGLSLEQVDKIGATPLHYGIHRPDMTTWLLKRGAKVNVADQGGKTVLHEAVTWGKAEVVQILLAAGADATQKDGEGKTALELANARLLWIRDSNLGPEATQEAQAIVKLLSSLD